MSGTKFKADEYVRCPYYCKESSIDIRCAGIIGIHTTSDFPSRKAKEEYKAEYCCTYGFYQGCPIYISLAEDGK